MQVILSAVQRQGNASEVSDCSADVVIKTHFVIGSYQWAAIFRRKDYVVEEISVRVPHDSRLSRVSTSDFYQEPSAASRATPNHLGRVPGVRWRSPRALCYRPLRGLPISEPRDVGHVLARSSPLRL